MIPARSPYSLIQEDVFPNDWLILIVSMMLNCTSRKQVEKVLPEFVKRWPDPVSFMKAEQQEIENVCRSLGFANRRSKNMLKMTAQFVNGQWNDPRELHGIGEYGARSFEIFCMNKLGDSAPDDGALSRYWHWRKQNEILSW